MSAIRIRPRPPLRPRSSPTSATSASAASATSPAPSASRSSAVGAATTLTTNISGSDTSATPDGSSIVPALNWVPISAPSTETVSCSGIDSASASISIVLVSWVTRVPRRLALDDDVDLDVHLLAAPHDEQVCVLDVAADGMDVERLGQGELFGALDVEGEHRVGAGMAQHGGELVGGQLEVLRSGAVAVEDGGTLPSAGHGATHPCPSGCVPKPSGCWWWGPVLAIMLLLYACCRSRGTARIATYQVPVDNGGPNHPRRDARTG